MSIPKPILVLSASFFGLYVAAAEDLASLIRQLDAKPYAESNGLRIEVQQLFIEASSPKANPLDLEELEKCLLNQLPDVREAISRQWLIRILKWFGSDASVSVLANYLGDSDKEREIVLAGRWLPTRLMRPLMYRSCLAAGGRGGEG